MTERIFNYAQELKKVFENIDSVELLFYSNSTKDGIIFYDNKSTSNIIAGVVLDCAIRLCKKYKLAYFVTFENEIVVFHAYILESV